MFSFVSLKRNLTHMLDEVNMKSNQREHQSIQVKRKKNAVFLCREFQCFFSGLGGKETEQKRGEMSGASKGGLSYFVSLFSYPVPSERQLLI